MYIANCSLGKDSVAMLILLIKYHYPLDRILWADMGRWAEFDCTYYFKKQVEDVLDVSIERIESNRWTWNSIFYSFPTRGKVDKIRGFAPTVGQGCRYRSWLKTEPLEEARGTGNIIYVGIAADESHRAEALQYKLDKQNEYRFPLIELGYTEAMCRKLCIEYDLLNPLYHQFRRLGCWGCPKQSLTSLRILRREYPGYWQALRKMQNECAWNFSTLGSIEDLEQRFLKEEMVVPESDTITFQKDEEVEGFKIKAGQVFEIYQEDEAFLKFYYFMKIHGIEILLTAHNVLEAGYHRYIYIS